VNQEDLSTFLVPEKAITHAERRVYEWVSGGARVSFAIVREQFAGLLVSQNVGDRIEYIRMLYTRPEFEGLGVGKGLIHSLTPRLLVFRSRRDSPPLRMLAESPSARMVCESKDWKLWTMEWRAKK
jgi:GNAT superfamily N-acetyltransferase